MGFQPVDIFSFVFIVARVGRRRSPGPARRPERAPACALCGAFRMSRASTACNEKKRAAGRLSAYSAATCIGFLPMLFHHTARMPMHWYLRPMSAPAAKPLRLQASRTPPAAGGAPCKKSSVSQFSVQVSLLGRARAPQGVDIFGRDFVVIPIHDHLHWSLAVLCFLGAEPAARGGADAPGACARRPFLLHLDSMSSARPALPCPTTILPYPNAGAGMRACHALYGHWERACAPLRTHPARAARLARGCAAAGLRERAATEGVRSLVPVYGRSHGALVGEPRGARLPAMRAKRSRGGRRRPHAGHGAQGHQRVPDARVAAQGAARSACPETLSNPAKSRQITAVAACSSAWRSCRRACACPTKK